jgi:hypothetical protein
VTGKWHHQQQEPQDTDGLSVFLGTNLELCGEQVPKYLLVLQGNPVAARESLTLSFRICNDVLASSIKLNQAAPNKDYVNMRRASCIKLGVDSLQKPKLAHVPTYPSYRGTGRMRLVLFHRKHELLVS